MSQVLKDIATGLSWMVVYAAGAVGLGLAGVALEARFPRALPAVLIVVGLLALAWLIGSDRRARARRARWEGE